MDDQAFKLLIWVLGAGVTIALAVIGGVIKWLGDDHKTTKFKLEDLRKDHSDFRVEVANKYVSHDHLQKLEDRLDKRFDELKALIMAGFNNGEK